MVLISRPAESRRLSCSLVDNIECCGDGSVINCETVADDLSVDLSGY